MQQLLRLQLTLASQLSRHCHTAGDALAGRPFLQGSLLCLDLGLREYVKSLFALVAVERLSALPAQRGQTQPDFRQEEILTLLETDGSWLNTLAQARDSMAFLPQQWQARTQSQADIITSSATTARPHWTQIEPESLALLVAKAEELSERHADFDREY